MAVNTVPIPSDPGLLANVRRYGTFDLTGCYQCGGCSVSCELVTDSISFPRRTIRYVLLGLKGPLVASLEPWICHDCGDCSLHCPRDAEPRLSMATMRRYLCAQYDWTGLTGKILSSRAWYAASLLFITALTLVLILAYHLYYIGLGLSDLKTPMGLEHVFPLMTYFTRTVILLPVLLLFSRAVRMWWISVHRAGYHLPLSAYFFEAKTYLVETLTHKMMRHCDDRSRWLGHWLLACGVSIMLALKLFALRWFQTDNLYPLYHPQRWVGYLAAAFILYGLAHIFIGRLRAQKEFYKQTRFADLVFPVLLLATALSGLGVNVFRYYGFALTSHYCFAAHVVVATPMLVVEMCFGKWSHMIYRPFALYLQAVKDRASRTLPAGEAVPHGI